MTLLRLQVELCFNEAGSDFDRSWITLIIVALVWVAPSVFIVFTSLKTPAAVTSTGAFVPPTDLAFENYSAAWSRGNFASSFFNSAIITVIKVPLGLLLSAMAAYALAKIKLKVSKALLLLVVFGTMIPFQVMLAPLFTLVNSFGLIDTYPGSFSPTSPFGVPYQVFILHGFFKGHSEGIVGGGTH